MNESEIETESMKSYIGTKIIQAAPMTRLAYNDFRGWTLPTDENGADEGYLVEYLDGGKPNVPTHAGYVSWSPKEQFEGAYRPATGLTFGMAVEALKKGERVARAGWNGKGMFLFLIQGSNDIASLHGYGFGEALGEPTFRDAIFMKTVDNQLVPWTATQTDCLAEDWQIVESPMKKALPYLIALTLAVGLAACGDKKTAEDKVTQHLTKSESIHALTADERQLAETNAKQFFNRSFPNGKDSAGELTTAKGMWLDCRPSDSNSNGLVTCHGILPKLSGGFDDKATRYCGYRPELVGCSDEDTVSSKR